MLADQFALFLSDLLSDSILAGLLCVIENIKLYRTFQILRYIPNDAIFLCCACVDSNIVGCDALQHVLTLAYANNLAFQLNTVDAWVFIFFSQPFPAKHLSYIINILFVHFLTTFLLSYLFYIYIITKFLHKIKERPLYHGFSQLFSSFGVLR